MPEATTATSSSSGTASGKSGDTPKRPVTAAATVSPTKRHKQIKYRATGMNSILMRYDPGTESVKRLKKPGSNPLAGTHWWYTDDNSAEMEETDDVGFVEPPWHTEATLQEQAGLYSCAFRIRDTRKSANLNWRLFTGVVLDQVDGKPITAEDEYIVVVRNAPLVVTQLRANDQLIMWDIVWKTKTAKKNSNFEDQCQFEIGEDFQTYYIKKAPAVKDGEEF